MGPLTHHAYVAYGAPSRVKDLAAIFVKGLGIAVAHNPDFHVHEYENLSVEDARSLAKRISLTGVGGSKVFIVAAQSLTREAQNALLKTLEEPPANTYIGFLVPQGALIATVRSRLVELKLPARIKEAAVAKEFLAASPAMRSKLISKVVEDKEKHAARELIDALEELLRGEMEEASARAALSELGIMRGYLLGPSPSVKMILEHLALVVPVRK